MRVFRCLLAIAIICGFTGLAGATPLDFHIRILDPPSTTFETTPITTTTFTFSFTACGTDELPGGATADGCFAGVNRTGEDWSNLQFTFANNSFLAGQPAGCAITGTNNIFSDTNCFLTPDSSTYILTFSDGVVANGDLFFITEDDVEPPENFGTGSAIANATVLTPEPASILLLSTGLLLFGLLFKMKRRYSGGLSLLS